jgi:serine/threonine protein kinase
LYMRVVAIYEATSSCPNVEHLLQRRDRERAIVVERGVVAKPINNDQLIACLQCLCEALQWLHRNGFMHRDIRWENVLRDKENAEKWVLVDLDDVIRTEDCSQSHRLDANSHAPEMALGRHDTMVDIWGIGYLLRTSYVILDAKLKGLMEKCLHQDPNQRPTATECLEFLKA